MLIYLLLPLAILYFLFLSRAIIVRNNNFFGNEIFVARNNITLFLWFVILLGLAVFKGVNVGTDYPMYYRFFLNGSYIDLEPGISFFYALAAEYDNFFIFSFCIYLVFLFFIFQGIKKNSPNYLISILLFILMFIYYSSYNGLRQMISVSIIFCFVTYIVSNQKKDRIKFLFIILIALMFHNSAIFLLLLFFIPIKKFSSKIVIPLFLLTIVLYFIPAFKNQVGELLINISGFYAEKYAQNQNYFFEVNKEKGLMQLAPVIIQMGIVLISLYVPQKNIKLNINYNLFNFSTNIVIINLCLYSLAGVEAIDRIQMYLTCFNIYFYSIFIHILLNYKKLYGQILIIFIIAFWFLYYSLRLINNVHGIVPYSFFKI
ncbi:EpsG family protein [Peribacillus castrilensis]|uniref:EpsG family protein n=1 Tax=Peribacillus TaxID=2675229 RepID=UPI0030FD11C8